MSHVGNNVIAVSRRKESETPKTKELFFALKSLAQQYLDLISVQDAKKSKKLEKNREQRRKKKENKSKGRGHNFHANLSSDPAPAPVVSKPPVVETPSISPVVASELPKKPTPNPATSKQTSSLSRGTPSSPMSAKKASPLISSLSSTKEGTSKKPMCQPSSGKTSKANGSSKDESSEDLPLSAVAALEAEEFRKKFLASKSQKPSEEQSDDETPSNPKASGRTRQDDDEEDRRFKPKEGPNAKSVTDKNSAAKRNTSTLQVKAKKGKEPDK